ncbi:Dabb family protein [Paenibacillus chartarius]|uniref:Dabb family protein n=1 Tax=Paenibacillus chartarius TaxID=747481 RepID=A0ABV6DQQ9_9BACL
MIQRTVLLKFAETTTREQLLEVCSRFKALQTAVPGIAEIQAGLNIAEKSKEFQVVLMVRFENQAALDAYTVNEDHQAVVAFIREVGRLDSIGVDIEI